VAKFKYLRTTDISQNCIHEDLRAPLNSGNASYRSVQSLLSSYSLFKNLRLKYMKYIKEDEVYGHVARVGDMRIA